MYFQDRVDAGQKLAAALKHYQKENPLILALPRGGVPIGYEVAKFLKATLDVFVVRKVGAPWNPEFGVGAVAPGVEFLDMKSLESLDLSAADMEETISQEREEVARRLRLYRGGESFPSVEGRTIILVDDGVATGVTTHVAIQALRKLKPRKLILAIPVGPEETLKMLEGEVEELVSLEIPTSFYAVSGFYYSFPQVSDEEVIAILHKAKETQE